MVQVIQCGCATVQLCDGTIIQCYSYPDLYMYIRYNYIVKNYLVSSHLVTKSCMSSLSLERIHTCNYSMHTYMYVAVLV